MVKVCPRCGEEKPFSEFAVRKDRGSPEVYCRVCYSAYRKLWYEKNKEKHKKVATLHRGRMIQENEPKFRAYLMEHPCVDCGERRLPVLELDHINGEPLKSKAGARVSLGRLMSGKWERVEAELAKCEVRCANCHKMRHAIENDSWRLGLEVRIFPE